MATRLASLERPWMQFFSEEAKAATIPEETIYQTLLRVNQNYPSDVAITFFDRKISYGELLNGIDRAAASFAALGVHEGDSVAIASVSIPEVVYSFYALNKLGATAVMLDPRRTGEEMKAFTDKSGCRIFMLLDVFYDQLKDFVEAEQFDKTVILSVDTSMPFIVRTLKKLKMPAPKITYTDTLIPYSEFEKIGQGNVTETVGFRPQQPVAIALTGGTTGFPKGVVLCNEGFNAIALSFKHCGVTYDRGEMFMDIIPCFASYGIVASLHMPLALGLNILLIPKFEKEKVGHYFKKYKPEHTLMVPAHYEILMQSKEMEGFDLSFFKTAGSGGDTMNVGLETKLNNWLKAHGCKYPLSQGYGMSEVSSAACCYCAGNFKSLSVGYPLLTNTIAIFRPDSTEELPYGEEGEICMTGPTNMIAYMDEPEETEKVMIRHPDGKIWVHSGDIGYMDEDGFITIKGRIKRMITSFEGHKIFPVYLESMIGKHPAVASCAVIGVADPDHAQGQIPIAVVQLAPEADETMARASLQSLFNEIEVRSRPAGLEIIPEMPHIGMGKIDYAGLVDMLTEQVKIHPEDAQASIA